MNCENATQRQPYIPRCSGVSLLVVFTIFAMQLAIRTDQFSDGLNMDRSRMVLKEQRLIQKFIESYSALSTNSVVIKNGVQYHFRHSPHDKCLIYWLLEREWFVYLQSCIWKISDIISTFILYIQRKSDLNMLGAFLVCLIIALVIAIIIGTVLDTFMKIIYPLKQLHLCPFCHQAYREYRNAAHNIETEDAESGISSEYDPDDGYSSQ